MASYRDDMQDTATASGKTWLGLRKTTEEAARAAAVVFSGLLFLVSESAIAIDTITDNARTLIAEQATTHSSVLDHKKRSDFLTAKAALSDRHYHGTAQTVHELAQAGGGVLDTATRAMLEDVATTSASIVYQKVRPNALDERAKVASAVFSVSSGLAEDAAIASSSVADKAKCGALITESLSAASLIIGNSATVKLTIDFVKVSSSITGRVNAVTLVDESAHAGGAAIEQRPTMVWTANTDNWAMSTYTGIECEQLVVVNGRLLAITKSGISEIGKESSELISAKLETDQIQITGDQKTHPVSALMDYSLNGGMAASLALTTRQSDTPETYHYPLSGRLESEDASGRFIFGRGLRAKKIALSLTITAKSGLVNSLNIETAESKRRI